MREADPISRVYAASLLEAAREASALEAVEGDVRLLLLVLEQEPSIRRALESPGIPRADKLAASGKALAGRHPLLQSLVRVVLRRGRGLQLVAILRAAAAGAEAARGVVVASLEAAEDVAAPRLEGLRRGLSGRLGRPVAFEARRDPALLAGVRIRFGDTLIDGTAARALADLKDRCARRLFGTPDGNPILAGGGA